MIIDSCDSGISVLNYCVYIIQYEGTKKQQQRQEDRQQNYVQVQ